MNTIEKVTAQASVKDVPVKRLFIGGRWVEARSGKTFPTYNPATGELLAYVAEGDAGDVEDAVAAARKAFEGPWRQYTPYQRQNLLLRIADIMESRYNEFATLDTLDAGMPIMRTRNSHQRVLGMLRFYAGQANALHGSTIPNSVPGDMFSYTVKEPVGVVGAITPWNGPTVVSIWKIAPALAAGCTIVLKPAEEASLTPLLIAEIMEEAGVPAGVVNIVTGYGETAGAALTGHPDVDKIAFTGSTETGQRIIKASANNIKRLSLELGGKSPAIVFADADWEKAVPGAAMAVLLNSGQVCVAGSRLFVERPIYEKFVEAVAEYAAKLKVGNGMEEDTHLGPIISQRQLNRVQGYLEKGASEGARLVTGGSRLKGPKYDNGYFVAPTVFADVQDEMAIAREEIFGPVISAMPFDTIDEVVKRANDTPFGLSSGVWTESLAKAQHMARAIKAGTVWINTYHSLDPAVPFGGVKMSGYGREGGAMHLDQFLETKTVWMRGA